MLNLEEKCLSGIINIDGTTGVVQEELYLLMANGGDCKVLIVIDFNAHSVIWEDKRAVRSGRNLKARPKFTGLQIMGILLLKPSRRFADHHQPYCCHSRSIFE